MAKQAKPGYVCTECGWTTARWVGRCGECQTWGSITEQGAPKVASVASTVPVSKAVPIAEVPADAATRVLTGLPELDRVLGGGVVPGAVALLAGEPGVGKSTLLLEVASRWARSGRRTLYVSGEESAAQVRLRAGRTNALADELYLAAETDLGTILGHIEQTEPTLLVVDSVQTVGVAEAEGSPGGVTQVREVTGALVRTAKRRGMAVMIIGHVTKEGTIAGPRMLEHLVDVVLSFDGDKHSGFRMVRAVKNRYGPADEVGCFEMTDTGIREVSDPSGLFTLGAPEPVPGTCVTVTMEGRRPLIAEVQALVSTSPTEKPRRITSGLDGSRLAMVLAVLERYVKVPLHAKDVYASTVGGARLQDPASDLALGIAVASGALDLALPTRVAAIGEVGLSGELRRVPGLDRRLAEAYRLGFGTAIVPAGSDAKAPAGQRVVEAESLAQALGALELRRARPAPKLRIVEGRS